MRLQTLLKLAGLPSIMGSLLGVLAIANLAPAAQAAGPSEQNTCSVPAPPNLNSSHRPFSLHTRSLVAHIASAGDVPMLDFTEAESDAAAVLFGCDCPSCINSLRVLRSNRLSGKKSTGHCWSNLQRRVSQQKIDETLKTLDLEK